ncbi:MAG: hypothetical protein ABSE43_13425 [Steroidobacteraceae bacterium]
MIRIHWEAPVGGPQSIAKQRLQVGRRLLVAALKACADLGGGELFFETNRILAPAIRPYESVGFVHAPEPAAPSRYVRADVYMRYKGGL